MVSPADIPINSIAWLFGAMACLALAGKSYLAYRESYNILTKYICWFGSIVGAALLCFSVPTLFTLNTGDLRYAWVIGELLVYISLIPQAAILWALVLRSHVSVYVPTVAVGILGLTAWVISAPGLTLYREGNFIGYSEPGVSTFIMALLLAGLFIPAGFHFMRATVRQPEFKGRLTTFVLGLVYIGIGVSTASHLLFYGQVASAASSLGNMAFFIVLLGVVIWPRKAKAKTPAIAIYGRPGR